MIEPEPEKTATIVQFGVAIVGFATVAVGALVAILRPNRHQKATEGRMTALEGKVKSLESEVGSCHEDRRKLMEENRELMRENLDVYRRAATPIPIEPIMERLRHIDEMVSAKGVKRGT